ncbi:hypothetical protein SA58113_2521 [Staphylococcus argenteus]|nr:hypothetical protein SA58113_2521 [Staphylococcus argenteus]
MLSPLLIIFFIVMSILEERRRSKKKQLEKEQENAQNQNDTEHIDKLESLQQSQDKNE